MKKIRLLFIVHCVLFMSIIPTACEFETSANGDLDGLWQLTKQDNASINPVSVDMRQSGIYWAVQVRLLQIHGGPQNGYYRFTLKGGYLTLRPANLDKEGREDTTALYRYRVKALNGSRMALENDMVKLDFRKY